MNRLFIFLLLQAASLGILLAQPGRQRIDESKLPGISGELNVRNAMYPRLLPDNRMEFKVKVPDDKKVQIDIGRKYDLTRNTDGEWTGTTDIHGRCGVKACIGLPRFFLNNTK